MSCLGYFLPLKVRLAFLLLLIAPLARLITKCHKPLLIALWLLFKVSRPEFLCSHPINFNYETLNDHLRLAEVFSTDAHRLLRRRPTEL